MLIALLTRYYSKVNTQRLKYHNLQHQTEKPGLLLFCRDVRSIDDYPVVDSQPRSRNYYFVTAVFHVRLISFSSCRNRRSKLFYKAGQL